MALARYDINDLVILKNGTFLNSLGVAVEPPTIRCLIKDPTGVETMYTYLTDAQLQHIGIGQYRLTIKPDSVGVWAYRWEALDPSAAIMVALEGQEEGQFYVRRSAFITV